MTKEEAIKLIEHISITFVPTDQYGDYDDPQPYEEALDMAIEALQNLSKPNNGLQGSDIISRQDAIDAIAKRIYHIEDGNENDALRKAICDIDALPSVNAIPYDSTVTLNSPTIIKATSTDLISRQDALEYFMTNTNWHDEDGYPIEDWDDKRKLLEDYFNGIPSADRPQGWAPCSERLPRAKYGESENVLVTCESGYIRLLYFNGGNWCYPTGEVYENSFDFVLAWMPLPEPYREDGEA